MDAKEAIKIVIDFEGGYTNNPKDPGGRTRYGISQRSFPEEDIKNLTIERATTIYELFYWDEMELDSIHPEVRLIIFDSGVNQGVRRASMFVQEIVGTKQDGIIGNHTLTELRKYIDQKGVLHFLREMFTLRMIHYSMLDKFYYFGKGWTRRLAEVLCISIDKHLSNR
jgi:lysozyme family protein